MSSILLFSKLLLFSMPGKIIQGLRKCESKNPVFLIDEIVLIHNDFCLIFLLYLQYYCFQNYFYSKKLEEEIEAELSETLEQNQKEFIVIVTDYEEELFLISNNHS